MSCVIAGMGTAVPRHRMSQSDTAELTESFCCQTAAQERLLSALYRRTGVEHRYSVLFGSAHGTLDSRQSFYSPSDGNGDRGPQTSCRMRRYALEAPPLAVQAARAALQDAGIAARRVTHLVTISCSGFSAPGFDVSLIKQLQLATGVARTHVGFMGCHGALNGLRVAQAFLEAEADACVLLCAVELCSLHYQYGWNPHRIVANALFSDGAAALVTVAAGRDHDARWHVAASGSTIFADSEDVITWDIGDYGFEMKLSPRVPGLIRQHLLPWLDGWLAGQGLSVATVGSWAIHPGGPRILGAFGEATGLDRAAMTVSERVLADYGNMSSPTVLFIVDRLRRSNAPRPCVALGFGPGLAVESVLLR